MKIRDFFTRPSSLRHLCPGITGKLRGKKSALKLVFLSGTLLVVLVILPGCFGGSAGPRGWSGVTPTDNVLYVGTMKGKLVAVNATDGSAGWTVPLEGTQPTGGLGCGQAAPAVYIYGSPAVATDLGLVYVGGYIASGGQDHGRLYAFASGRQEPKWKYPRDTTLGGGVAGSPILVGSRVYFTAADGKVYALDAADGYSEWSFETGGKIWSTPAVNGERIYVGSFDKKLYALNINDGSKQWEFATNGAIVATPLVHEGTVYVGSFDRHLYAVNAADGSKRWDFRAGNWFWARPVVYNGVVYAASLDGTVYAINAASGEEANRISLGSAISSSPVIVDGLLIVATEEGVIYAVDTGTNEQRWRTSEPKDKGAKIYAPLVADQGTVYVHATNDAVYAVNASSGTIRELKKLE